MTDYEFLKNILIDFFESEIIQTRLVDIEKLAITDWEKWLQVELFIFLDKLKGQRLAEVERECRLELNLGTSVSKYSGYQHNYVDFMIKRKFLKNEEKWIPLEIKIGRTLRNCLDNMAYDEAKYSAVKKTIKRNKLLRLPFFLGIYPNYKRIKDQESVGDILEKYDLKNIPSIQIPNTNFSWILYYLTN